MSPFTDPSTHLAFSVFENKGVFSLLIGSGVSRASDIPTGWEITTDLVRRVALSSGIEEQADWAKWYTETEGREPDYSHLLEQLAASPGERRSMLHSYIEPSEEDREEGRKLPTKAHHAIADLVQRGFIKVILTTNFDRLLESALREKGVEPTVISSVDALEGAEPISHSTCYVFKIHGDYKDARILNTDDELDTYPAEYSALLDRVFDEYGLIVCGWSGEWDHALRAAMSRAPNRRYPLYWASRGKLRGAAHDLAKARDARVVPISDADSFFTSLSDRITTLEQSQAQNPVSVDLLVRSTKRFLAGPEHRIQLADLLADETERTLARLDASDLAPQGTWSDEEFRRRVSAYETSTEALAKMVGTLGRWGAGGEKSHVIDAIGSFVAYADNQNGGLVPLINIRSYPAVLLFTAYGIGLARASRWSDLHELFSVELPRPHSDPETALQHLFSFSWKGGDKNYWQKLEGYERRVTPLSDHLYEGVFKQWAQSFFGSMHSFEETFELVEILASISFLDGIPKKKLAETLSQEPKQYAWNSMGIGRSCWHQEMRERLLTRIKSDAMSKALLDSGFSQGDREFLDLAITNYKRASSHIARF